MDDMTILQIIPADEKTVAIYDDPNARGGEYHSPVFCWALVETAGGHRYVMGMESSGGGRELMPCEEKDFIQYHRTETEEIE